MKIGFIAHYDPTSRKSWSGTYSSIIHELQKEHTVETIYTKLNFFEKEVLFEQRNWYRWFKKKNFRYDFLKLFAKYSSKRLDSVLANKQYDLLIAPAANSRFAYSKTAIPIICIIDATFKDLHNYYKDYSNIPTYNYKQALEIDRAAFNKATFVLSASDWAANTVVKDYGIDASKVIVQPFGANLIHEPAKDSLTWQRRQTCRLLFLGVDWNRKGGPIAVEALQELNAKGIKASLQIIGCIPPEEVQQIPNITVIPFLDKNNPEEEHRLIEIIHESDFLFLPTRAECAGIVFCEASAYGLPIISTNTGGVSNYVIEGVNGYLLEEDKTGKEYAMLIQKAFADSEKYNVLRRSTRKLFEEKLNWHAWMQRFNEIAKPLVSRKIN